MKKLNLKFYLLLAFLFLLGIAGVYRTPPGLWHKVAEALIVASILGATVDLYLKQKILKEASMDISKFLIGYSLPVEIQNEIRTLMQTSLLRRDMEVRYEIKRNGQERCNVSVELFYMMENFTNQVQRYRQVMQFEASEKPRVTELRLDTDDKRAAYCLRANADLEIKEQEGVVTAVGREVDIEPKDSAKTYRFGASFSLNFPITYADIISFGNITKRVVLRIIAPPDLEVHVGRDETTLVTDGLYDYRRVFLPAQHIRIRWKPKQTVT